MLSSPVGEKLMEVAASNNNFDTVEEADEVLHPVRPELHLVEETVGETANGGVDMIPAKGLERQ